MLVSRSVSETYESQKPHFDNPRMEFPGDAVPQLMVTEDLFRMFPEFTEGRLTKPRSRVVSRRAIARFAMTIQPQAAVYRIVGESGPDHHQAFHADDGHFDLVELGRYEIAHVFPHPPGDVDDTGDRCGRHRRSM